MSARGLLLCVVISLCSINCYADQRVLYMLHCGGCHLADGRGNPPQVPSIRNVLGQIVRVDGGRDYLVQVPGASQAPVTDQELTAVAGIGMKTGDVGVEGFQAMDEVVFE